MAADGALVRLRGVDLRKVAHGAVAHHGVRADRAVLADDRLAAQDGPGQERRSRTDLHARVDVDAVRVHDDHTVRQMLFHDLLAAHRLRGAQLLSIAPRQKALGDLTALGERGKRAVLAQHVAAGVRRSGIHRAAGEHAHRQHHAVDDQNAARFALKELQKLLRVLRAVNKGDVRVLGQIRLHLLLRGNVGNNKKPLNAAPAQLRAHPRQDGAEQNGLQHQRRLLFGTGDVVRHEKHGDLLVHRIVPSFASASIFICIIPNLFEKSTFSCNFPKKFFMLCMNSCNAQNNVKESEFYG